jgi:type I restriction enzyme S subunit
MIPEGWNNGKISDVVSTLEAGVSVNGEDRELSSNEKGVLKVSAVSYGIFDKNAQKVITDKTELERAKTSPKSGEIIISRSNTKELVGASAYIPRDYDHLFLPDKLWQTVTRKNTNSKWLSYVLASRRSRYTLSQLATGTSGSMRNITKSELFDLRILIPPRQEQDKIANILSTWDKAIETVEKLIENSRTRKKALMQQLLSGRKRLPGFSKSWREVRFDSVFERVTRKNIINNDNVLTISGQHGLVNQRDYFNKNIASDNLTGYTLLERGEFAYNKSYSKGYPMGVIKPLTKYDQGVISNLYICFRLKDNRPFSQEFFRHYF